MEAAGIAQPGRAARAMYAALGTSLVEFLWLSLAGRRALRDVRIDGASVKAWRDALGRGRGVVVAASHTGNWDLAACAIAQDVELAVVTKRLRVRWLDRLWQGTRAAQGVRLVDAAGAVPAVRAMLARGGAVAMMIDQVPASARHAVTVDFLGRPALVDRGPAALAAACAAPLVVAVSRRLSDGTHRLYVLDVLQPPVRPGPDWVRTATAAATLALDAFVREHPSQWLWLHRRWKRLDPAPAEAMLASPCRTPSSSPDEASRAA